jgi:hypothetical protein
MFHLKKHTEVYLRQPLIFHRVGIPGSGMVELTKKRIKEAEQEKNG